MFSALFTILKLAFGKEHEVAAGEARLRGEDEPKHYKQ
jgi:hypothetical protein